MGGTDPIADLKRFLAEDIGTMDITSEFLPRTLIKAKIFSRDPGAIISGTKHVRRLFLLSDCRVKILTKDGQRLRKNQSVLEISGTPQSVLSCERTALNLLSRMSGIATQTRELVDKIPKTVGLFATRKTAPGLRQFDKEAVESGGGKKHRMALDSAVLFKDNHIMVGKSIEDLIIRAKKKYSKVEIEVETSADAVLAAKTGASVIMLDNFTPGQISKTVTLLKDLNLRSRVMLEASGKITRNNIERFAKTGVDMISVGAITHSVRGVDFSLDVLSSRRKSASV